MPVQRPLRAFAPLLAALALCPLAALLIGADPAGPVRRAERVLALERALGIAVEPAVHAWARQSTAVMTLAGVFYVVAHVGVAGWALVWTWCMRRDAFPRVRAAFVTTQLALAACYVAVPTAPPRLLGAPFADTLSSLWGREAADSAHAVQSAYASMPSGHVAFAAVAGLVFARYGDRRWLRAFGVAYPPLVAAVVVLTANHFVLDVAAGALLGCGVWMASGASAARRRRAAPRACVARRA
jgi:membrane-associated phospholipid phosphatase